MTHRISIILGAVIAVCVMMSVGFASWAITDDRPTESANGDVGSEGIFYSNDYIKFDGDSFECFRYTYRGFKTGDGDNIEDIDFRHGEMKATYIIDLFRCKSIYNANNIVTVEFSVKLKNSVSNNVFNQEFVSVEYDAEDGLLVSSSYNSGARNDTFYSSVEIDLNSLTDQTASVTLTYKFDFSEFEDYGNYIYDVFNGTNQEFEFDARITERA